MESASWKVLGALRWLASRPLMMSFTHVLVVPDDAFVRAPALLAALLARPAGPVAMPLSEDGRSMVRGKANPNPNPGSHARLPPAAPAPSPSPPPLFRGEW